MQGTIKQIFLYEVDETCNETSYFVLAYIIDVVGVYNGGAGWNCSINVSIVKVPKIEVLPIWRVFKR